MEDDQAQDVEKGVDTDERPDEEPVEDLEAPAETQENIEGGVVCRISCLRTCNASA